jgi:hypothetical protein
VPSRDFNRLKSNIHQLKQEFLSFPDRADGGYTKSERMKCRAFIAFCHAEFEYYLEETATKILNRTEQAWLRRKRVGKALAALLVYRLSKDVSLSEDPRTQNSDNRLEAQVRKAISQHRAVIRGNHGIRARNIAELFTPLGLQYDDFNEPLIIQLNNLSQRRGDLVHASAQVSLPRLRDPFTDEWRDVNFLIEEIASFDLLLKDL